MKVKGGVSPLSTVGIIRSFSHCPLCISLPPLNCICDEHLILMMLKIQVQIKAIPKLEMSAHWWIPICHFATSYQTHGALPESPCLDLVFSSGNFKVSGLWPILHWQHFNLFFKFKKAANIFHCLRYLCRKNKFLSWCVHYYTKQSNRAVCSVDGHMEKEASFRVCT